MSHRLLAGALALALLVTPALAAGAFPAVLTYAGFDDVKETDWYYSAVKQCYETRLMNGTGKGNFSPNGTMTLAESAVIAARLGNIFDGTVLIAPGENAPWYGPAYDYLRWKLVPGQDALTVGNALYNALSASPERTATRQEFFDLLAAVTPSSELPVINSITALPDTNDTGVLAFYNAGILTGTDKYGTFNAAGTLTRAECAAMVARIADPALRRNFIPQEKPAAVTPIPSSAPAGDALVTVNGHGVDSATFQALFCNLAYSLDYQLYATYGQRLDWSQRYTIGDPIQYVLDATTEMAVYRGLLEIQAEALGCTPEEVPQRMNPSPDAQALQAYINDNDLLCAKHILCTDKDTAQAVLDGLEAVPTLDQFNALLQVFGTDPGMESNPNGYLFTAGEMVSEFENGVRGLAIGSYSTEPVQSSYGYHIIWRLDPVSHPDLKVAYQEKVLDELLIVQAQQAQVTTNEAAIAALDVPAIYNAFLSSLSSQQ